MCVEWQGVQQGNLRGDVSIEYIPSKLIRQRGIHLLVCKSHLDKTDFKEALGEQRLAFRHLRSQGTSRGNGPVGWIGAERGNLRRPWEAIPSLALPALALPTAVRTHLQPQASW